jgi:hypothetical protein
MPIWRLQRRTRQSIDRIVLETGGMPPALTHDPEAILASKRISNPFRGIGVILPDAVNSETVFIPSGWQWEAGHPDSLLILLHQEMIDIPIIEISCQAHLFSFRGI